MIRKILKYTYWIVIAILIIPASKYYYNLARDHFFPTTETKYYQQFVFTVPKEFLSFFSVFNEIQMTDYRLREKALSSTEKSKLVERAKKLKNEYEKKSLELNDKLLATLKHYPDQQLEKLVHEFIEWKKKNKFVAYPYNENNDWSRQYRKFEDEIYMRLRQLSGIYNIKSPKEAYTMSILPEAIKRLKEKPNDPKLCSVMSDYNDRSSIEDSPEKIAKSVAFVEYGQQLCSNYYNKRSAWGILGEKSGPNTDSKKYLAYPEYYKTKVMPMMPKALAALEDTSKKSSPDADVYCDKLDFRGLMHRRDPFRDAMIAVAKQKRPDLCANKLGIEKQNFNITSYHCLDTAMVFCGEPNHCDAVEICKPFSGPLFED